MKNVYVIVQDVRGPAGHGEPGAEYFALGVDRECAYSKGTPKPIYTTEKAARDAIDKLKYSYWLRVIPIPLVNGCGCGFDTCVECNS